MVVKFSELKLYKKMKILNFENIMKKFILKNNTMNKNELQKVYSYKKNSRYSKIKKDQVFVKIDNRSQGGLHWTSFIVNDKKSY